MSAIVTNYFRPAYEARSVIFWIVAALYSLALLVVMKLGLPALAAMFGISCVMAVWRYCQASKVWDFKISLAGYAVEIMPATQFEQNRPELNGDLWLGWGYRWQPKHAQLAYEVLKRNMEEIYPPQWFLKMRGVTVDPREAKGLPWIHGLDKEKDVIVPFKALEGHTAILAITGAIKTRLFTLLVYQLAARGDVVIALDPKGDKDLQNIFKEVARMLETPEKFVMFHPAFSKQSIRFDALASWDRETQVASRVRMIMSAAEDDNFVSFVWMTVTHTVGCMKRIGRRVSIATLLDCVQSQSAAEELARRVLEEFLKGEVDHIDTLLDHRVKEMENEAARKGKGKAASQIASPRLAAMVEHFKQNVSEQRRPREISGLIAALEANREWFGKMIVALTPILTKLSSGDLGAMLSPDYEDVADERPILNAGKLIRGGYLAYFGLDALGDTSVAEAIAAMLLSDLAGTAGEIYNYEDPNQRTRKVHIICDEWGDLVCEPIIQIANKARGAGVVLYLAGQTFSDLVVKMGSRDKGLRIMGNMNNMLVGATNDADTLDMVMAKFGETTIQQVSHGHSAGQKTEDAGLEFSANRAVSIKETAGDLVQRNLIMSLPDLQYFAMLNRSQIYQGRIPVMTLQ